MIPGMGGRGMNPKRLQAMMRQMGIDMEDIDDVEEVVIRTADKDIVIKPAEVSRITQSGQESWQVVGKVAYVPKSGAKPAAATAGAAPPATAAPKFTEEDVALVAEQAKVSKEAARKALQETDGQPADAILKLMGEE